MPCHIGANHCRLRHLGWEKCGHGLTSRPQETSHPDFLDSLLAVFGYPLGSGGLLLSGDLPLRFCSGNFALRRPSWSLPDSGGVQALLSEGSPDLSIAELPAVQGRAHSGVAGLKELEGLGRECDLPRKRPVRWFAGMVFPMFFTVLGERDFDLMMRFWVLGLAVIKGDVFHCMSTVFFLGKGMGNVLWLLHCPVSPGSCLISG